MKDKFLEFCDQRISAMETTRKMITNRRKNGPISKAMQNMDEHLCLAIKAFEIVVHDIKHFDI